jgi:hypothetical protein
MNIVTTPTFVGRIVTLVIALLGGTLVHAQGTYLYQTGYARTGGCDPVVDDPADLFLQDAGAPMRDRHPVSARAQAPSGNAAWYDGSIKLGQIYPFRVRARAVKPVGCTQQMGQATVNFQYIDKIDVRAGAHPDGTPITYTATVVLPVDLHGRGARCGIDSALSAQLWLHDQSASWSTAGPYQGTGSVVVSATAAVGQRIMIGMSTQGTASAVHYSTNDNACTSNEVSLTAPVRITLTADTLGANMTSINGVRYDARP